MSEKKSMTYHLLKGIVKENPVLVLGLGLCPTLGTTSSATNGLGMGLSTTAVLILSNLLISILKKFIPDKIRIPIFIVTIATFVTIADMVIHAYFDDLYKSLGLFIPLIVVNCVILGRAEAFAFKNGVFDSILDGIGMGLGFTVTLTVLGGIREVLGNGSLFNVNIGFISSPALMMILAPGAFLTLGFMLAGINKYLDMKGEK